MGQKLEDALAYLLAKYQNKRELSNARVTKMIYLADWRQAIEKGRTITDISWKFDHFGPFVWDVKDHASESDRFMVSDDTNCYGSNKTMLSLNTSFKQPAIGSGLSEDERAALDHVILKTQGLNWDDFIRLVYSTHPIMSSSRYHELDLVEKAKEYKAARV